MLYSTECSHLFLTMSFAVSVQKATGVWEAGRDALLSHKFWEDHHESHNKWQILEVNQGFFLFHNVFGILYYFSLTCRIYEI